MIKIKELFDFEKGSLQSTKCVPGEFDFITAASEWKSHHEYEREEEALIFAAAASGSLGRTHYVNGKFISSDLCFIITPKDSVKCPVDLRFYHLIFNTLKEDIVKNTKAGTSKEAISLTAFGNYFLPYFPIEKQRLVKETFLATEKSSVALSAELTQQLQLVKQLREAFLREAMAGMLTQSWREAQPAGGETGAELLEKIKAEKARLIAEKKLKKGKLTRRCGQKGLD